MIDPKFQTFITLCDTRSYTKTAELLYITQPSVTHHIKTLEKMYDCKLFTSNSKNFKLTQQGELLYKYAMQLLAFDNEFDRIITQSHQSNKVITFAATQEAMNAYLKYVLPEWNKEELNNLIIKVMAFSEISKQLVEGKIDFAVVDNCFNKKSFKVLPLLKTRLVIGTSSNNKHSFIKKMSYDSIIDEKMILAPISSGKMEFINNELSIKNRNTSEISNYVEVNNPETIVSMVENGCGLGFFYESELTYEVKKGSISIIDLQESKNVVDINLIYSKDHLASNEIEEIGFKFQQTYKSVMFNKYSMNFN